MDQLLKIEISIIMKPDPTSASIQTGLLKQLYSHIGTVKLFIKHCSIVSPLIGSWHFPLHRLEIIDTQLHRYQNDTLLPS